MSSGTPSTARRGDAAMRLTVGAVLLLLVLAAGAVARSVTLVGSLSWVPSATLARY
jgi:hypothetical protein